MNAVEQLLNELAVDPNADELVYIRALQAAAEPTAEPVGHARRIIPSCGDAPTSAPIEPSRWPYLQVSSKTPSTEARAGGYACKQRRTKSPVRIPSDAARERQ